MGNRSKRQVNKINPYSPEYISLFKLLYGENLISLGGLKSVDAMFDGIKLAGSTALDLGFGLGGIAYYLAEKYHMDICGVELHQWMVNYANEHKPHNLTNKLLFKSYDQHGNIPYAKESFCIAYSKGVLNHVKDKTILFKKVNKTLKEEGLFVIADWLTSASAPDYSSPIVSETKKSYFKVLQASGFHDINIRDKKVNFQKYVNDFIDRLNRNKIVIENSFGDKMFSEILDQHITLYNKITDGTKVPVRLVAKKFNSC